MKKTIILIGSCIMVSVFTIFFLYKKSDKLLHVKNNFIRFFPSHPLDYIEKLDIKYDSYYIAGTTDEYIYLGNYEAPTHLLVTDYQLSDTTHLRLQLADTLRARLSGIQVSIDYPHVYMAEGVTPVLYYGNLSRSHSIRKHPLNSIFEQLYFTAAVPISYSSFVLRTYDDGLKQNILTKISTDSSLIHAPDILEKQIDGIFCTDGMLHYDASSKRLVYVYYYRNQFICMDNKLNVIYKGKTIDTISQARITVSPLSSKKSMLSSPPLSVNKSSCARDNRLYINSGLLAKNEDEESFKKNLVIDTYSLNDGRYLFSFYLPIFNRKKTQDFFVSGNKVVILYDHYIVAYDLNY